MCYFKYDISDMCSPLTFDGSTTVTVDLSTGGIALLNTPFSADGKVVRVKVAGNLTVADGANHPVIVLAAGNSLPAVGELCTSVAGQNTGTLPFLIDCEIVWTSGSADVAGFYHSYCYGGQLLTQYVLTTGINDAQFYIAARSENGVIFSSPATLELTEFSVTLN